ncbi:MAG: 16S rRNA (cytidine(1402)-2'-O)-methyltransferase [Firmicutes bacterium]|nr:16S rRNA (cytidine(1402)-2'-O)-methyltransferase [Bacillota bacterium]
MSGTLYLCATPIGNMEDITLRVISLLRQCDLIAAEDTRNTMKILNRFDIKTPVTSYHEHNKHVKGPIIIEKLKCGMNVALVTDAGMPGISDPGGDLASLCYENGVNFTVAPGANAAVTALVLSAMNARRFVFEGFLPHDKKEREKVLKSIEKEERTVIFYEAPHRLTETLEHLLKHAGNRNAACVREITKKFEEVKKDSIKNLLKHYETEPPRGEFVIILEGADSDKMRQNEIREFEKMTVEEHVAMYVEKGFPEKEAMKLAAKDRGVSKRDIYSVLKRECK